MKFLFFMFSMSIALVCLAFWVFCIIEIVRSEFKSTNDKIIWLILVLWLPVLGSLLYIGIGRKNRMESLDDFV